LILLDKTGAGDGNRKHVIPRSAWVSGISSEDPRSRRFRAQIHFPVVHPEKVHLLQEKVYFAVRGDSEHISAWLWRKKR